MIKIDSFKTDQPSPVDCKIKGSIPKWVEGRLYRDGPAKYKFGPDEFLHLFDGMAVIHCYKIQDGCVKYQNRLLDSDTYKKNTAANRIVVTEFGTVANVDPCKSIFSRFASRFIDMMTFTDNDGVNVMQLGDQIYAMTETPIMNLVDPQTLDRIEKVDWNKYVAVHSASAHPLTDSDGVTYTFGTQFGPQCHYKFIRVPPPQPGDPNPVRHAELVGSIPAQWKWMPSYSHSFGMTQNYLVFVEQPLGINLLKLMASSFTKTSYAECMHFYDDHEAKIYLLHKYTGGVIPITYVTKPFFTFHHINAYEDGNHVVVDLAGYNDAEIINALWLKNLRDPEKKQPFGFFKRFVLPLPANKQNSELINLDYTTATARLLDDGSIYCVPESPDDVVIELPQINYKMCNGKKYNYVYGLQVFAHDQAKLVKYDIRNKVQKQWFLDSHFPGEPVFVGKPGAKEEDDGVILSPCISLQEGCESFLLVLDAKTFTELARAELPTDVCMPNTFHGFFTDSIKNLSLDD